MIFHIRKNINRYYKFLTGFTKIEIAVVLGVIFLLLFFVVIAIQTSRAEARDMQRLSDVRQLSMIVEAQYIDTPNEPLSGCEAPYSLSSACTGPGKIQQFKKIQDPVSGNNQPCQGAASGFLSQNFCAYSVSSLDAKTQAATNNYQICFFIERGGIIKGFAKGIYHIETGGLLKAGCN